MFQPANPSPDFPRLEETIFRYWQIHHIFEKTNRLTGEHPVFNFHEKPQDVYREPDFHDLAPLVVKDLILRYKTQTGFALRRRAAWNTHGLIIERAVEQQSGLRDKRHITELGMARFCDLARRTAFKYLQDWVRFYERCGYWADLEEALVTQTPEYIETVWQAFQTHWQKGFLKYERRVVPFCTRCGTSLGENDVYQAIHPEGKSGVLVRLPLVEDPGTSLLVWSDSPWKLTGNVAVAAHPEQEYVILEHNLEETPAGNPSGAERLILARGSVKRLFPGENVKVFETFKGRQLKDLHYRPLFTYLVPEKAAYRVLITSQVDRSIGSGLLSLAPVYDEPACRLVDEFDLPLLETLDEEGRFIAQFGPWRGLLAYQANDGILADLERRGLLLQDNFSVEAENTCAFCQTPLISMLRWGWFLVVGEQKNPLAELSRQIRWTPPEDGELFVRWNNLKGDWLVSRERFWGAPLPAWKCDVCGYVQVVGSRPELAKLAGIRPDIQDLHLPSLATLQYACPECKSPEARMRHIPMVLDSLFETSLVSLLPDPASAFQTGDEQVFMPADLVVAGENDVQRWFSAVHTQLGLLQHEPAFRHALTVDATAGENKSWEYIENLGVEPLRWAFLRQWQRSGNPLDEDSLAASAVYVNALWSVFAEFTAFASRSGWAPGNATQVLALLRKAAYTPLDRWLLSHLHQLIQRVTDSFESFEINRISPACETFVEDLKNWYLPLIRGRLRQTAHLPTSQAAFATLYEALVTLARLLAPALPFLAEEIYQALVHRIDEQTTESVHLTQWPVADNSLIQPGLETSMELLRSLTNLSQIARQEAGYPPWQPLAQMNFYLDAPDEVEKVQDFQEILREKVSAKNIRIGWRAAEDMLFALHMRAEQLLESDPQVYKDMHEALSLVDAEDAGRKLLAGKTVALQINERTIQLRPEEVEVILTSPEGWQIYTQGSRLVMLDLQLSPELEQEGLALEFIHAVENLRMEAGLNPAEPVHLSCLAGERLTRAIFAFHGRIMDHTGAVSLESGRPDSEMITRTLTIGDERVELGLKPAHPGRIP
jgi:isoleucyl-tRNA synthetase